MATTVTHNLKLNVPDFDQDPWDVDVNTNWLVLDATVGMFSAIPNLTGVWKNSTAYTYGQSVIDAVDSSVWQCAQAHTSSAAPTIFSLERITYPIRWTQTTQGAQFYASQSASSAAAAAASATAAAASAATVNNALPLAGGTMLGMLTLFADPTNTLHAATKHYVDQQVGGTGFMPLTGGVFTGLVTSGASGFAYGNIAVGDRHQISFGWNGTLYGAVNGTYIGALATQTYVSGAYLPLAGGNISGSLYVAGESQSGTIFRLISSGAYFYSTGTETVLNMDSGNWGWHYARASGNMMYWRPDGVNLFNISPGGFISSAAGMHSGGSIDAAAYLYARGGIIMWGAADRSRLVSDNATYTAVQFLDAYRWLLTWGDGALYWQRYDGANLFSIDVAGNTTSYGNFFASYQIQSGTNVVANQNLYASGTNMIFGAGGLGRIMQFQGNWYWNWNAGNGDLVWMANGGDFMHINQGDGVVYDYRGPFAGNGAYFNFSDERLKSDITAVTYGLDAIRSLRPIRFKRKLDTPHNDRMEIGFSAQQVRRIIPEAVQAMSNKLDEANTELNEENPLLAISLDPIVAALVNGMIEMATRIERLEADRGTTTH